jgi:hypothetical protein
MGIGLLVGSIIISNGYSYADCDDRSVTANVLATVSVRRFRLRLRQCQCLRRRQCLRLRQRQRHCLAAANVFAAAVAIANVIMQQTNKPDPLGWSAGRRSIF